MPKPVAEMLKPVAETLGRAQKSYENLKKGN
jgi:hypothetical protein